jgi:hypothetical protein
VFYLLTLPFRPVLLLLFGLIFLPFHDSLSFRFIILRLILKVAVRAFVLPMRS